MAGRSVGLERFSGGSWNGELVGAVLTVCDASIDLGEFYKVAHLVPLSFPKGLSDNLDPDR
jgi:hypothetical protein